MNTRGETFSVRIGSSTKKQLEKLAKSTGRSRAFLAAEAINEYLVVQDWQVQGIKQAIASLDAGYGVPHEDTKQWVASWGAKRECLMPKA